MKYHKMHRSNSDCLLQRSTLHPGMLDGYLILDAKGMPADWATSVAIPIFGEYEIP